MKELNAVERIAKVSADNFEIISQVRTKDILAIAEAFRTLEQEVQKNLEGALTWQQRAEEAEAKLATKQQELSQYVECFEAEAARADRNHAKLAELEKQAPIGRIDRGEANDNNEYPDVRVVCLHDQADWDNFQDGTELFLRPSPAVGMEKHEPYAWLVHAPQGDYVERNPEVVAHLEGTGLTKCKPLYLDL